MFVCVCECTGILCTIDIITTYGCAQVCELLHPVSIAGAATDIGPAKGRNWDSR